MADGDIEVCKNILVDWVNKDRKAFMDSIQYLIDTKQFTLDSIQHMTPLITKIVKEISTSKSQDYDGYMQQILTLKSKLKQRQQLLKKKQTAQYKRDASKSDSKDKNNIVFSESFGSELDQKRKKCAENLYNSFLRNFSQKYEQKTLEKLIIDIQKEVNELWRYLIQYLGTDIKMIRHLGSLMTNLSSLQSSYAKKEMLAGNITAKQVASNKTSIFQDKSSSKKGEVPKQKEEELNGNGQQCISCHAMEAYCYSMQQIRASDEPMTRFLRCRSCKDTWTD